MEADFTTDSGNGKFLTVSTSGVTSNFTNYTAVTTFEGYNKIRVNVLNSSAVTDNFYLSKKVMIRTYKNYD